MLTAKQVLIGLFVILVIAVGVATNKPVPFCEQFQFYPMVSGSGELVFIVNQENAKKMVALVNGLNEGSCRLPE